MFSVFQWFPRDAAIGRLIPFGSTLGSGSAGLVMKRKKDGIRKAGKQEWSIAFNLPSESSVRL